MDLVKHQRRSRLELKPRHHVDNLHALYRESEDPVERSRWHTIWLLATGHSIPQVAQTLGYATRWVPTPSTATTKASPWLTSGTKTQASPPCSLQSFKRPSVRLYDNPIPGMACGPSATPPSGFGRPVDPRRAWSWMKRLGFAPLRPRRRERNLEEGEAFKKLFFIVLSLSALRRSNLLKHLFPWLVLELWVGLKPVCRGCGRPGERRTWPGCGRGTGGSSTGSARDLRVRFRGSEYEGERVLAAAHGER